MSVLGIAGLVLPGLASHSRRLAGRPGSEPEPDPPDRHGQGDHRPGPHPAGSWRMNWPSTRPTGERERRARKELEAYTKLVLSRRRVEDFDRQGNGDLPRRWWRTAGSARPRCMLLQPVGRVPAGGSGGLRPGHGEGARRPGLPHSGRRVPIAGVRQAGGRQQPDTGVEPGTVADARRRPGPSSLYLDSGGAHCRAGESTEGALLLAGMRENDHRILCAGTTCCRWRCWWRACRQCAARPRCWRN